MAGVRAKFFVAEVTEYAHGSYRVVLRAVTKHGPHDPADNEFFWDATPSGELTLSLSGTAGKGAFEYYRARMGKDIYIEMTEAEGVYAKCQVTSFQRKDGDRRFVTVHQPGCPEHDAAVWEEYEASKA